MFTTYSPSYFCENALCRRESMGTVFDSDGNGKTQTHVLCVGHGNEYRAHHPGAEWQPHVARQRTTR